MPYGTVLSDGAGVSGVLLEDADVWGGIFVLSSGGFSYLARCLSCSVMIFCISEFISDRRLLSSIDLAGFSRCLVLFCVPTLFCAYLII